MVTITCTMTWRDGQKISAVISAPDPDQDYPVRYQGALARLPHDIPSQYTAGDLPAAMRNLARRLGATLTIEESGAYDVWAE